MNRGRKQVRRVRSGKIKGKQEGSKKEEGCKCK